MLRFRYIAVAADGDRESGVIEADDELSALQRLNALGLAVTDIQPDNGNSVSFWQSAAPKLSQQADLADQLAILFASGLSAPQVTQIVSQASENRVIRRHFQHMLQLQAEGVTFDEALAGGSGVLSPLFGILAGIGQHSGQPGQQMPALALTLRIQARLKDNISNAFIYPVILLIGGCGIVAVMAIFLAPRLEVIFTSVNQPVPGTISGFINLGAVIKLWGLPLIAGLMIVVGWLLRRLSQPSQDTFRVLQSLPLIGPALREAALARLTRACHLMLEAGLPLATALDYAAQSYSSEPMARIFSEASTALEEGHAANSVFTQVTTLPILLRELFRIGEETNTLPRVLASAAQGLEERVEQRLTRLMALLTPLLILLIGGLIALVVASVMGAVLSVNDLAL